MAVDVNDGELEKLALESDGLNGAITALVGDVSSEEGVIALVRASAEHLGSLDHGLEVVQQARVAARVVPGPFSRFVDSHGHLRSGRPPLCVTSRVDVPASSRAWCHIVRVS